MKAMELASNVYAAGQIFEQDIKTVASYGVRSIINNRPDNEEMGQPLSADLEQLAQNVGLAYAHVPIVTVPATEREFDDFSRVYEKLEKPILLFCRTGARSTALWQLQQRKDDN